MSNISVYSQRVEGETIARNNSQRYPKSIKTKTNRHKKLNELKT